MSKRKETYRASLEIDYPKKLNRLSSFFRVIWVLPILLITVMISGSGSDTYTYQMDKNKEEVVVSATESPEDTDKSENQVSEMTSGIAFGLFVATALMILFRQRYPRWWFDFNLELNRFSTRVYAYILLLTDRYPSTEDEQSVHLELQYPNVKKDLNRWLPLIKWFLAIPHYVVLVFHVVGATFATIVAWFSILFTGKYPKRLFNYVVGVGRWGWRVTAYAFLLTTDDYPPFSLK